MNTPGGEWICPALVAIFAVSVLIRVWLARRECRRFGNVEGGPFRD